VKNKTQAWCLKNQTENKVHTLTKSPMANLWAEVAV